MQLEEDYFTLTPQGRVVSKVVIPAKAGIQTDIIRHDFWIPNQVKVVLDTDFRRYGSWE